MPQEKRAPRPVSSNWVQNRQYGIVVDAGSSGSRVQVYSWIDPKLALSLRKSSNQSPDALSKVEKGVEHGDGWHLKVEPGISSFAHQPEAVGPYLKPLIDYAASVIPSSQHASTPIYLLATAGMRLLPTEDSTQVLAATCTYLKQSYAFRIDNCLENIKVITGEEEGLYGWIAVNYLMDGFDKHQHSGKGEAHSSTYGFLDMGGASTQIAFEPSEAERVKHADNLLEVQMTLLSGKQVTHPVFVTTFLGFGTNQARSRYVDQEIKAFLKVSDAAHDLAATALAPSLDESTYADRPIVFVDDPCLPKNLMLTEQRHSGYTLRGTGNFSSCVKKTGPLLNKEVACLDLPCLFNGVHVPVIDFSVNHFIGISEYWYSTQDVWSMGNIYDFVEFERNAMAYCGRDWRDIMKDHEAGVRWKSSVELSRLETQCFKAAWIVNILHEGIGIPRIIDAGGEGSGKNLGEKGMSKALDKGLLPKKPPHFQSLNQVNDVAISWTLGKMVLEVSKGSTTAGQLAPNPSIVSESPSVFPILPDVSAGVASSLSADWRGHIPAWSGDVRSTLAPLTTVDPFAYIALTLLAIALYLLCISPHSLRRRKALLTSLFTSKRRSAGEYGLMASDDSADSADSGTRSIPSRSPSRSSVNLTSLLSRFRYGFHVLASSLRNWSPDPATTSVSPFSGARRSLLPLATLPRFDQPPPRPRGVRQTHSTPVFPRANSTLPSTVTSTNYYNDAPDVSERIPKLFNSIAPIISFTNSPPVVPIGLTTSRPPSRPTTPAWIAANPTAPSLTKLRRESSANLDETSSTYVSSGTSTPPNPVWDESEFTASPLSTNVGGAKLRTSKSLNTSQVNLAGVYSVGANTTIGVGSARRESSLGLEEI